MIHVGAQSSICNISYCFLVLFNHNNNGQTSKQIRLISLKKKDLNHCSRPNKGGATTHGQCKPHRVTSNQGRGKDKTLIPEIFLMVKEKITESHFR